MKAFLKTVARPHIIKRLLVERLTEPLHLNVLSAFPALFGSYQAKIAFDLIIRQQHAYGLLRAGELAKARGLRKVTVVELGVGSGTGLLNMVDIAQRLTPEISVDYEIFGFDTGQGMPPPRDYRDHPELYREGDYPMEQDRLRAKLPSNAQLIVGDLAKTIPEMVAKLRPEAPIGFVTLDVDYYWSSKIALKVLEGDARVYLPQFPMYVDDIQEDSHNEFSGELLAIEEFNREHEGRKIARDRFLRFNRIFKNAEWIEHMYKAHVVDHPERTTARKNNNPVPVLNPYL